MNTTLFCPVSNESVNGRIARITAALVFSFLLTFLISGNQWLIGILFLDFLLRAVNLRRYSLLAVTSKKIHLFIPGGSNVNLGPKLFAARLGLTFTLFILITSLSGFAVLSLVLAVILALFSFLEFAFGYCLACEIYPFLYRYLYRD